MTKEVFTRRSNKAARTLTVSTEGIARRVAIAPGDYIGRVTKAQLIAPGRGDNISVVLEIVDPESGDYFDVRPLWVAGPNAGNVNMAARNISIVSDLLDAVGVPVTAYRAFDDELLDKLVGRTFDLTFGLDQGRSGGVFVTITRVNGVVEPDVVQFPNSAAD